MLTTGLGDNSAKCGMCLGAQTPAVAFQSGRTFIQILSQNSNMDFKPADAWNRG